MPLNPWSGLVLLGVLQQNIYKHVALQIKCTCKQAVIRSHTTDSFLVHLTNPGRWFARMHKQVRADTAVCITGD